MALRLSLSLALSLAALALATGCGPKPVPLTAELRAEHRLGAEDLQRLQLYVSDDVTLRRESERLDRQIDRGSLKLRAGKVVDEIVIDRRTPCVASEVHDDRIVVAFQDGTTLAFALPEQRDSAPELREPLVLGPRFAEPPSSGLLADRASPAPTLELRGTYSLAVQAGVVRYRGLEWQPVKDSLRAQLLVATEELSDVDERRTVLGGRRL